MVPLRNTGTEKPISHVELAFAPVDGMIKVAVLPCKLASTSDITRVLPALILPRGSTRVSLLDLEIKEMPEKRSGGVSVDANALMICPLDDDRVGCESAITST